jgi:ABC-type multidrug transport system ATPase subunit
MKISLKNVGRRFNKEWIFKNISCDFSNKSYAILGPNGSGKSTFLSIILGNLTPSEGEIFYNQDKEVAVENIYKYISFAAPYLDLIEEFTLQETIEFHFNFKKFAYGLNTNSIIDLLGLTKSKDKALKHFSSGMKQRTKLALACCADTPILILDEPTSNLDVQGIDWYLELMENFSRDKTILIGSNQNHEYSFCTEQLKITDYK